MSKNRPKLITIIQTLIVVSILSLSITILIFQVISQRRSFKPQLTIIQDNYNLVQKEIIYDQVNRTVDHIENKLKNIETQIESETKDRAYEAFAIAQNIYKENVASKSEQEIKKMIMDALRPIRFKNNIGYYFILHRDGEIILFDDIPDLVGENMTTLKDSTGDLIFLDYLTLQTEKTEGITSYNWTKPNAEGFDHKKISFLKLFEPYDWFIGTGLYVEDIIAETLDELLIDISQIRFGTDGYIFVNDYSGNALVANGEYLSGDKKLWEVFDDDVDKSKNLFKMELEAALTDKGDYIYYSINKLGNSVVQSPKVSFIYGIDQIEWLIGAGVYLDDIQDEIISLQNISQDLMIRNIRYTIIITVIIALLLTLFFIFISRNLKTDFILFSDFFNEGSINNKKINREAVKYRELYYLAESANNMQIEKHESEIKLKDSEMKFRLLAENSKDMIFKMSMPDGNYDYVSPASIDILGYTPKEIMDEPCLVKNSIHSNWKDWFEEKVNQALNGSVDEALEYQIINKSGETIWINQKNKIIKDEYGNPVALVGRLSDDTERKNIEDQLRHNYRLDVIGQIAGGLSHDFNNILGGIMNAAQVLSSPKRHMDDKGLLMVDLIRKSAKRASELTSKLSTFSRKRTITLNLMNLHSIINETLGVLNESINKDIEIVVNANAQNPIVLGDATELQSAILNVVINGAHAISGKGKITLETSNRVLDSAYCSTIPFQITPGEYIQLEISDTGSGIEKDVLDRIFEPFYSTKSEGKGTGLGLATVYAAIKDHHGAIVIDSEPNKGSSFFLLLPSSNKKLNEKIEQDNKISKAGKGTILVVDDEEIIRITSKNMLEDMGYKVLTAEDGKNAVDIYKEKWEEIDLVIMDMIMPNMNGSKAFYKIREINNKCHIIIASGFTKDEDINELKSAGLSGFLKKPFTDVELNSMIVNISNS